MICLIFMALRAIYILFEITLFFDSPCSYPKVTYNDPKVIYSDPEVTYSNPTHLPLPPPASHEPYQAISFKAFHLSPTLSYPCLTLPEIIIKASGTNCEHFKLNNMYL